ncbi:hypothetical protein AVEN_235457-1 [Araneus ventricosus]|uniref:Retropepsins domain-containing protein n=1 Tax=Araneus ventricosus TaxID=182803 RepID=A0A4Y2A3V7_ARAVE|nr:hypothetical protein AVEN_235457-1 [Araneus ventricosus]
MKKRAPIEFKKHFWDEWLNIVSPSELGEKLEKFEDVRKTLKPNSFGNSFKGSNENKGRFNKFEKQPRYENPVEETSKLVRTCSIASQGEVKTRNIIIGKEPVTALVDTGSSVKLIRKDFSKNIIDHSKLSKDRIVLSGIGGSQVSTRGSFQQHFTVDEEEYCLTWHIVTPAQLKFKAVIGSDILDQASGF